MALTTFSKALEKMRNSCSGTIVRDWFIYIRGTDNVSIDRYVSVHVYHLPIIDGSSSSSQSAQFVMSLMSNFPWIVNGPSWSYMLFSVERKPRRVFGFSCKFILNSKLSSSRFYNMPKLCIVVKNPFSRTSDFTPFSRSFHDILTVWDYFVKSYAAFFFSSICRVRWMRLTPSETVWTDVNPSST